MTKEELADSLVLKRQEQYKIEFEARKKKCKLNRKEVIKKRIIETWVNTKPLESIKIEEPVHTEVEKKIIKQRKLYPKERHYYYQSEEFKKAERERIKDYKKRNKAKVSAYNKVYNKFVSWLSSDNVFNTVDGYITQCTQYKKFFTKKAL